MDQERKKLARQSKNVIRQGSFLLFALSFALLCFYQIVYYETWIILCTIIGSGVVGFLLIRKTWEDVAGCIRAHRVFAFLCLCAALIIVKAMHLDRAARHMDLVLQPLPSLELRLFRLRWMVFTIPAVFWLLVWVLRKVKGFFSSFWKGLGPADRKLYAGVTLLASAAVLIAYVVDSGWFLQDDHVYSIDSGFCFRYIFGSPSYYDIRHPVMSVVTFPLWAVIHTVLGGFVPANLLDALCAVCIQIVNIQMILLVGFMIRELSENRWVLPLYLASFPVLLFTMSLEKYPIVVFFLVLYIYRLCRGEKGPETGFVLAAGMMPTSAFLYVNEVILKQPLREKLKRLLVIFVIGAVVLLCTGRTHLLYPPILLEQVSSMAGRFGIRGMALENCLFALTKMAHSIFFGLSSTAYETRYFWTDVLESPSVPGVAVFVVMALGAFVNRQDHFTRACAIWVGVSAVLFCAVQWSVDESPLFGLYFAWAFLPLFQKGVQFILEKLRLNERIAYGFLIAAMFVVNLSVLIDIGKFFRTIAF